MKIELLEDLTVEEEFISLNDTLKFRVNYNLEKSIPKLVKMELHSSGIRDVREKFVCEEETGEISILIVKTI